MEKVQNQLFLNYLRSNGKEFDAIINNFRKSLITGAVHVFPEILVPGSSSAEHDMLTALANSLFLEARSHNMSMAPYGHLDPVKIAIAGTFIGVLMTDLIGDLSVIGKYSFSNINFGKTLAMARDIALVETEEQFANYCKRFNMLVAKVNSMYIPVTGFARRWYEHRRYIYKDDEGDRYSLYTYYLQNYYEYIVDPSDSNAGRLVCRWRTHKYAEYEDIDEATSFTDKLEVIEGLVNRYLSDDDVANFCAEALNAGMPHMEFAPLKSVQHETEHAGRVEQFVGPELKLIYSLDDIQGLENACFVAPTAVDYVKNGAAEYLNWATWDIYEDITKGTLICGSTNSNANVLPAFSSSPSAVIQGSDNWPIGNRPLFTHAKVTSLPGLTNLTRYVVATGAKVVSPTLQPSSTVSVRTYFNGTELNNYQFTSVAVAELTVHGTEILAGHFAISTSKTGELLIHETSRMMQMIYGTSASSLLSRIKTEGNLNTGFKARFVTYLGEFGSGGLTLSQLISDFDYVTSVTDDALSTFFGANAWNDTMLISKLTEESSSKNEEKK